MKTLITLIFIAQSFLSFSQDQNNVEYKDKLFLTIGVSYSPSLCFSADAQLKGVQSTYTPSFEVTVGNRNFDVYAKAGELLEFGVRGGNNFLMAGIGYSVNYRAVQKEKHIVFAELGYHVEFKKGMFLFLSTKQGVLLMESRYFFSPLNVSLKFTINQ